MTGPKEALHTLKAADQATKVRVEKDAGRELALGDLIITALQKLTEYGAKEPDLINTHAVYLQSHIPKTVIEISDSDFQEYYEPKGLFIRVTTREAGKRDVITNMEISNDPDKFDDKKRHYAFSRVGYSEKAIHILQKVIERAQPMSRDAYRQIENAK